MLDVKVGLWFLNYTSPLLEVISLSYNFINLPVGDHTKETSIDWDNSVFFILESSLTKRHVS